MIIEGMIEGFPDVHKRTRTWYKEKEDLAKNGRRKMEKIANTRRPSFADYYDTISWIMCMARPTQRTLTVVQSRFRQARLCVVAVLAPDQRNIAKLVQAEYRTHITRKANRSSCAKTRSLAKSEDTTRGRPLAWFNSPPVGVLIRGSTRESSASSGSYTVMCKNRRLCLQDPDLLDSRSFPFGAG